MAVASYVLDGSADLCRALFRESSKRLLENVRYDRAHPNPRARHDPATRFREVLCASISGDITLAEALACEIAEWIDELQEREHRFLETYGKAIIYLFARREQAAAEAIKGFAEYAPLKAKLFVAHAAMLVAVNGNNGPDADAAAAKVSHNHGSLIRRDASGIDIFEKFFSYFGVGMTNLARHRGMSVGPHEPYIPTDLLISG